MPARSPFDLTKWADGDWATANGTYTVHVGGSSASTPLTRAVPMTFTNTAPTAQNVTAAVDQGSSVVIELRASDPDGDPLSYTYSNTGGHTVTPLGNGSVVRFMPRAGFVGTTSFTYTVNDGHGGTASATVTVTVRSTPGGGTPGEPDKDKSKIKEVKVRPKPLTTDDRPRVSFRVVSGGEPAEGRFVIKEGKRVLGKGALDDQGRAKLRIKRLDAGKHRLKIVYKGSADSERATKTKSVRVRRA